jgi:hypothetical protein
MAARRTDPVAAPNRQDEVLVRIHATTVNRTDCGLRSADPFITGYFTDLRRDPDQTPAGKRLPRVALARGPPQDPQPYHVRWGRLDWIVVVPVVPMAAR